MCCGLIFRQAVGKRIPKSGKEASSHERVLLFRFRMPLLYIISFCSSFLQSQIPTPLMPPAAPPAAPAQNHRFCTPPARYRPIPSGLSQPRIPPPSAVATASTARIRAAAFLRFLPRRQADGAAGEEYVQQQQDHLPWFRPISANPSGHKNRCGAVGASDNRYGCGAVSSSDDGCRIPFCPRHAGQ